MKTLFTITWPNRSTPSTPRPTKGVAHAVWCLVLGLAWTSTVALAQAPVPDSSDVKVSGLLQE